MAPVSVQAKRSLTDEKRGGDRKPPSKLLMGGAAGFMLILLGVIIIIRNQEGEEVGRINVDVPKGGAIDVQQPPGDTNGIENEVVSTTAPQGSGTETKAMLKEKPVDVPPLQVITPSIPTATNGSYIRWPFDPPDGREYKWSDPENLGPTVNSATGDSKWPLDKHPTLSSDQLCLITQKQFHDIPGLYEFRRKSANEPWGTGVKIIDTNDDADPWLSADGLTLLSSSKNWTKELGVQDGSEIWQRQRPNRDAPWGPAKNLGPPINSVADELGPALSPDGLVLVFHSLERPGGHGSIDLYISRRTTLNAPWEPPKNLGATVNSPTFDDNAQFLADGKSLLFTGKGKLVMAMANAEGNYDLVKLPEQTHTYHSPWLSPDGQTLYFHTRDLPGGLGHDDIWITHRVLK